MIIEFRIRVEVEEPPCYVADNTDGKRDMNRLLREMEDVIDNSSYNIDNSKWEISHETW